MFALVVLCCLHHVGCQGLYELMVDLYMYAHTGGHIGGVWYLHACILTMHPLPSGSMQQRTEPPPQGVPGPSTEGCLPAGLHPTHRGCPRKPPPRHRHHHPLQCRQRHLPCTPAAASHVTGDGGCPQPWAGSCGKCTGVHIPCGSKWGCEQRGCVRALVSHQLWLGWGGHACCGQWQLAGFGGSIWLLARIIKPRTTRVTRQHHSARTW